MKKKQQQRTNEPEKKIFVFVWIITIDDDSSVCLNINTAEYIFWQLNSLSLSLPVEYILFMRGLAHISIFDLKEKKINQKIKYKMSTKLLWIYVKSLLTQILLPYLFRTCDEKKELLFIGVKVFFQWFSAKISLCTKKIHFNKMMRRRKTKKIVFICMIFDLWLEFYISQNNIQRFNFLCVMFTAFNIYRCINEWWAQK